MNIELYINNKKYKYNKYCKTEKKGIYTIILKFNNISIKDCSYMFYNYENIINIYLSLFDYKNILKLVIYFIIVRN